MSGQMSLFGMVQRGMSAQMVRMNAAASNLANAGSVASTEEAAYRPMRAVFQQELDQASGLSSVRVSRPPRRCRPDQTATIPATPRPMPMATFGKPRR
jgi:flagellar basal body rod protein FlgC